MCSTGPFQFRWLRGYIHSSCYYHHQIGSINLTHYHIFPWLCAWNVCYIIFCHLLHIHSGKTGILFSLILCRLCRVQIFGYVLACKSCWFVCTLHLWSHYHHCANLSEHIELIHCLGLCHETIVCAVCLYILISQSGLSKRLFKPLTPGGHHR